MSTTGGSIGGSTGGSVSVYSVTAKLVTDTLQDTDKLIFSPVGLYQSKMLIMSDPVGDKSPITQPPIGNVASVPLGTPDMLLIFAAFVAVPFFILYTAPTYPT